MLQNPSHSLPTSAISRRQSNRASRPNSTVDLPVSILFTKVNPKPHVSHIKSLGGFIVDTPQLGTILICDTALRTFKFLYAIIKGIPIVTSKWLDASYKAGTFVPVNSFLLTDIEAEKRFQFSLKRSLGKIYKHLKIFFFFFKLAIIQNRFQFSFAEISRKIKLFEKYKFMATPNSQPVPNEIAELVRCGGGEFLFNPPDKFEINDCVVLITEKDDNRHWRKYQRMYDNIRIVSSEGFMQSILQQKINFKNYMLR